MIAIPVNETITAIMSTRVIFSAKIIRDRTATAKGAVEIMTVPIDKGSILNT